MGNFINELLGQLRYWLPYVHLTMVCLGDEIEYSTFCLCLDCFANQKYEDLKLTDII